MNLRYFAGMTVAEVAAALRVSVAAQFVRDEARVRGDGYQGVRPSEVARHSLWGTRTSTFTFVAYGLEVACITRAVTPFLPLESQRW